MDAFKTFEGVVVPIDQANVDTDAIIPKQFLKSIERTGFGDNLFDEWRYLDRGEPGQDCSDRPRNPDFVLNQSTYSNAQVLLGRRNFGCGSSREHAVWALRDFGIRVVIAPSFADIFFNNSFKNGLLLVALEETAVDRLFELVTEQPGFTVKTDLDVQQLTYGEGESLSFDVDSFRKYCLVNGLDDIDLTLRYQSEIRGYEERRQQEAPWLFAR
jgi:3-isopropylmalate/(R)-2-methylmalate dehydratase small subunit